jgi:hypothetical protein
VPAGLLCGVQRQCCTEGIRSVNRRNDNINDSDDATLVTVRLSVQYRSRAKLEISRALTDLLSKKSPI